MILFFKKIVFQLSTPSVSAIIACYMVPSCTAQSTSNNFPAVTAPTNSVMVSNVSVPVVNNISANEDVLRHSVSNAFRSTSVSKVVFKEVWSCEICPLGFHLSISFKE